MYAYIKQKQWMKPLCTVSSRKQRETATLPNFKMTVRQQHGWLQCTDSCDGVTS